MNQGIQKIVGVVFIILLIIVGIGPVFATPGTHTIEPSDDTDAKNETGQQTDEGEFPAPEGELTAVTGFTPSIPAEGIDGR